MNDVTNNKPIQIAEKLEKVEKKLSEIENMYRHLIKHSNDAIYLLYDNKFEIINDKFQEIFGITLEEAQQPEFNFLHLVAPQSQSLIKERFKRIDAGEKVEPRYEFTALSKSGEEIEVEANVSYIKYKNGTATQGIIRDISKHKRAEKALKLSEEQYRVLTENMFDIVYASNRDGIVTYISPQIKRYGVDPEEIISKEFLEFVHPEDQGKLAQEYYRTINNGEEFPSIFRLIDAEGQSHWFEDRGKVQRDIHGNISGVSGVLRDVTEQKRAEEELQRLHQKNKLILDSAGEGILGFDLKGNTTFINPAVTRLTGWETEDLIGKNEHEMIHHSRKNGEPYPLNECPIYNTLNKGVVRKGNSEYFWRKDGSSIPVDYISMPMIEEDRIVGAVVTFNDVTARKQAEEQIRKLSAAMEQSPFSVVITDLEGSIEYVNPKFSEITGYSFKDVQGKNPRMLKSGENSPEEYVELWETITSGRIWHGEFHNKKKNGELFWEEATIGPIKNNEGQITHYVAVKEDITEKKKLEDQYRQAQRMEAVGRLAGGVAHDFNNLLTVINGYSDFMLMDLKQEDPFYIDVVEIREAGRRAADLTRQLLAFSRRQVFEMRVLNLNIIIQNLEKMLRRIIGEDVKLITSLKEDLCSIRADSGQIEQVITNIIVNARDAIPYSGSITIETSNIELDQFYASGHNMVEQGNYVMLAISDTGIGMSGEISTQIFEPFFTTKELGKGTGLGLSTVYGIVKQSGGYIWVYSEPGQGTTFKIYFPQVNERPDTLNSKDSKISLYKGTETILLVEDEDSVRLVAKKMLVKNGYTVFSAKNGHEALKICEQQKDAIHLVLTDVIMPGISARELVKEVNIICPKMKVLYISGYTDDAIVQHGVLDPGVHLLQKPFSKDKLLSKVREVLISN